MRESEEKEVISSDKDILTPKRTSFTGTMFGAPCGCGHSQQDHEVIEQYYDLICHRCKTNCDIKGNLVCTML
jgi:hypothetical protein